MIRAAETKDLPQIEEMEKELFPDHPWTKKEFDYEMEENPYSSIYVYETDRIAGYIILWVMYEQAEIANIGVAGKYQNRHVGSELMAYVIRKAVEAGCESLSLEVRISNKPAIHLYEKFGFIRINIRKNYYENGEDAYLMLKPLGGLSYDDAAGN